MSLKKTKYTKTKLTQGEVSVEIDLEKLIGKAAKNEAVRETFFQLAFDQMMERLSEGKSFDGKAMKGYSKNYKDSLSYEVFGKDGTVNLQLTGDMVNDVQIVKQTEKLMKIGLGSDENNAKAYAHQTGFEGHPTLEGKVKKREWFGWTDDTLEKLAKELKPTLQEEDVIKDEKILNLLEKFIG